MCLRDAVTQTAKEKRERENKIEQFKMKKCLQVRETRDWLCVSRTRVHEGKRNFSPGNRCIIGKTQHNSE